MIDDDALLSRIFPDCETVGLMRKLGNVGRVNGPIIKTFLNFLWEHGVD